MTYGHALDLLRSCARPLCTRPATITTDDGRLTCARHALDEETRMPTTPIAVRIRAAVDEASASVALLRHATASPHETTRPIVVHTLAGKVRQLERFDVDHHPDWTIRLAPQALRDGRWIIEHDRTTLYAPDAADVQLARAIIDARIDLGRQLRRDVLATVDALGLPNRRQYLRSAARR